MKQKEYCSAGALLGIGNTPAIVAVVGCGGKTSFIESLAREFRHKKVLITPTTKIFPMTDQNIIMKKNLSECGSHQSVNGIQCLGIYNEANGKLEAIPPRLLTEIVPQYDLVLLEADGSRSLPCKGWRENEPVVPPFSTHTVGIVTLNALMKTADKENVLNLNEFLRLTGLSNGSLIHSKALLDMVCAKDGMFRFAAGIQSVFVNQAEDEKNAGEAVSWLMEWPEEIQNRFFVLAYGSAKANLWKEVRQ